ncbi:MAG: non-ribosomal peptide synthetase, partial [Gammaproteobacteria bacterium]|nr:non-ribosomal peptide synthetase [Gammaproteobacteria bacterium]
MTRFRYDVTLHIDGGQAPLTQIQWLDWQKEHFDLAKARRLLLEKTNDIIGLTNIPNARLVAEAEIAEQLARPEGTVEKLRTFISRLDNGVEPEEFRALADGLSRTSHISYRGKYSYSVVFQRQASHEALPCFEEAGHAAKRPWHTYGNNPLQDTAAGHQLIPELRDFIKQTLPDYMMPSAFIALESMPLTPNGKIDRKALPAPEIEIKTGARPKTPTEDLLAGLMAHVLKCEVINRDDNFFEQGGHSLLATRLTARIRDAFQVELPVRAVFEHPVLSQLASVIEAAAREVSLPPISKQPVTNNQVLSYAQQRLWFLNQFEEPGSATYNMPVALRLKGDLDITALQSSLHWLLQRHESLRSVFPARNGQASVRIQNLEQIEVLTIHDLTGLPGEARAAEVQNRANRHAIEPFDLARGPLFKAELLSLDKQQSALLLNMHHIISDGWSMGVFIRDWQHAYTAFAQGEQPNLPPLAIQYSDYAVWQRDWLQGAVLQQQEDYWRRQLAGSPELLELPTDKTRPPRQSFQGAHYA